MSGRERTQRNDGKGSYFVKFMYPIQITSYYQARRGGRVCYVVRLLGGQRQGDATCRNGLISLRFFHASCPSLALLARVVGDSSNPPKLCVISAAIQSSPPPARVVPPFRSQSRNVRGACSVLLLRSPRRKLLCRDIGLSLRRPR